ncbi:hypothetical protein ACN28S_51735 [Cystobacter fuscus]
MDFASFQRHEEGIGIHALLHGLGERLTTFQAIAKTRGTVAKKKAQVSHGSQIVLPETPERILEISLGAFLARRVGIQINPPLAQEILLEGAHELVASHHANAMQPVRLLQDPRMSFGDQREETFRPTEDVMKLQGESLCSPLLQIPQQPRVEGVVASPIGDVGNAWNELSIERDARRLNSEMIQPVLRRGRPNPGGFHPHPSRG